MATSLPTKMLSQCSSRVLAALARNGCAAGNVVHIQSANIASSPPAASDRGGRDVVKSLTSKKIIFEKNVIAKILDCIDYGRVRFS